jgi:predicted metalloprotease with PDZ domain
MTSVSRILFVLVCFAFPSPRASAGPPDMTISVDARTPWKRCLPVRLMLPARPGPLKLVFPRWLPGMHAMEGPLYNFARLALTVDGTPLTWRRDPFDAYIIHVEVPKGGKVVEATYEYVPAASGGAEVFYGVASGKSLAVLNPSAFALAPEGDPRALTAALCVRLPKGWSAATALLPANGASESPETIAFAPVSLYTLVDSPILAGAYRKTITLPSPTGDVPHTLDLFGDTEEIIAKKEAVVVPLVTRLVAESAKMFGGRHYRAFRFMLALSREVRRNGLEHHESVAYVLEPDDLDTGKDAGKKATPQDAWNAMLIPHEFVHSWNGKFRRPYGEDAARNTSPQSTDLLWVYEGLTQYLGDVLMVRCGFRTPENWRRDLTRHAAGLRFGPGRDWQSVADAAIAASHVYVQGAGTSLRGPGDIYFEGMLIWLEADAIIRRESRGARSLDDFCRLFFGGPNNGAEVVRYTLKEVIESLKRVQPYDWDGFVRERFYGPPKGLPTGGLEAAGWKLTFGDAPEDMASEATTDYRHSLGVFVTTQGRAFDPVPGSPAEKAGLESGMNLLGVNGSLFTPARLREAVRATKGGKAALELLVADGDRYRTLRLEGVDGERFPSLIRNEALPDLLAAIAAPKSPPAR